MGTVSLGGDGGAMSPAGLMMGMAMGGVMGGQMTRMMNQTMQNMYSPGAMSPMSNQQNNSLPNLPNILYAVIDGNTVGPMAEADVIRMISNNQITKETYVWKPGMSEWQKVESIPEVMKLLLMSPPIFNK